MKPGSVLALSPTFSYPSTAASQQESNQNVVQQQDEVNVEERFSFHHRGTDHDAFTVSADQIFANGKIRPIFPVINTTTPVCHLRVQSAPEALPGTYTPWEPKSHHQMTPSERWKKMSSIGTSKFWRLKNMVIANNADRKEAVPIISRAFTRTKTKKTGEGKVEDKNEGSGSGRGRRSAHEIHYTTNRSLKEVERRRSYLPYKKDIVGLFGNVSSWNKVKMFAHSRIHPQG